MKEIRFRLHPNQAKEYEESVCRRVAQIVAGTNEIFKKEGDFHWMLGGGNDWWMEKDKKTGEFILAYRLAYRYGGGHETQMNALRTVIIWLLGLEDFNK